MPTAQIGMPHDFFWRTVHWYSAQAKWEQFRIHVLFKQHVRSELVISSSDCAQFSKSSLSGSDLHVEFHV